MSVGKKPVKLDDIIERVNLEFLDFGVGRIVDAFFTDFRVNLNPDYQRGHVWTDEQRCEYIGFLLQGGRGLPMIINQVPRYELRPDCYERYDMLDGKQRFTSIAMWLKGDIPAKLLNGREIWREQFVDKPSQSQLNHGLMVRVGVCSLDRASVLRYYLKLNGGGTAHTREELQRVYNLLQQEVRNVK